MKPADAPPRFETKSEWVYARLREMITRGDLRSGERLRLTHLAREFDTSVMPVHEALRMLQRDGLIEMESHRGASVAHVTWERVVEAVMIRMHLETLAAAEGAAHHDAASLDRLDQQLDRMDALVERRRSTEYSEANRLFHSLVENACPFPLLREEIQHLWTRCAARAPGRCSGCRPSA